MFEINTEIGENRFQLKPVLIIQRGMRHSKE